MPILSHATSSTEVDHFQVAMVICKYVYTWVHVSTNCCFSHAANLRVSLTLVATLVTAIVVAQLLLQPAMRVLANNASHELYQLALVSFCLLCAMVTGYLVRAGSCFCYMGMRLVCVGVCIHQRQTPQGLSTELGAFIGGVMLSTTDQQESALHAIEAVVKMFVALFIASTGLILSPVFLIQHLPVLTAGLLLVVVTKTLLFSFVVWIFGYAVHICVAVGLSMAQIGEFAFVLLSIARSSEIIQHQLYMLLMGTHLAFSNISLYRVAIFA